MATGVVLGMLLVTVAALAGLSLVPRYGQFVPVLLQGAVVTLQITALAFVLAVGAALASALMRLYAPAPLGWISTAYVEVFRGTSALVQLFWLYFVLPRLGLSIDAFAVAVLALGLNIGAYGSEVVRGAINAIPRGQWEASVALNMTRRQALQRIILPQSFLVMIPPWGNLLIELLKSTALVSLITLTDLTFRAQQLNQATFKTVEIFTLVLLFYLAMSLVITIGIRLVETRLATGSSRGRAA